jgi:hypothetical protein
MEDKSEIITRRTCRIDNSELIELFDLGELYASDFLSNGQEPNKPKVPLTLCIGKTSGLVQLKHTTPSSFMYEEYWYRSGMNSTMTNELKGIVEHVKNLVTLKSGDIVVDIGCNDGTLLKFYPPQITKVGFDPAKNLYEYSSQHSTLTVVDYFNSEAYFNHYKEKAKVVTSIAMFYDLENPNKFVEDVKAVLDDEGLWIMQMSYLPLMLRQMAFDNICHEHLEYYSLTSLKYILDRHGFKIVDVVLNDINGGSYRIYIRKKEANDLNFSTTQERDVGAIRVESLLEYEKKLKLNEPQTYLDYYKQVMNSKEKFNQFVNEEKAKGKVFWGYGASTKGNTLLQFFGINHTHIDAIAERNPAKWGKHTIGSNIPIKSEEEMRNVKPDYLLVLPWHFRQEFLQRETTYLENGGKFIFPLPKFEVIGKEIVVH